MGIIDTPGFFIPEPAYILGTPTQIVNTLDAAGEKLGTVFQAPKTGSIRKIGLKIGTATLATDTDVRIETVDLSTGMPTGTLWGTDTNVLVSSASIVTNTWVTTGALTADAVVTQGDILAVVIAPTLVPNYTILLPAITTQSQGFPYNVHFTSSWATLLTNMGFAIEYSDGTYAYIPGSYPIQGFSINTFNSGSAADEIALRFRLPFAFRLKGIWLSLDLDGDCDIVLYDADGTSELRTLAVDKDLKSGATLRQPFFFCWSQSVELLTNTFYRVAIRPSTVTDITLSLMTVATGAIMSQMSGGADFLYSWRVDGGAWTNPGTVRYLIGVHIDGIGVEGSGQRGSGQIPGAILVS